MHFDHQNNIQAIFYTVLCVPRGKSEIWKRLNSCGKIPLAAGNVKYNRFTSIFWSNPHGAPDHFVRSICILSFFRKNHQQLRDSKTRSTQNTLNRHHTFNRVCLKPKQFVRYRSGCTEAARYERFVRKRFLFANILFEMSVKIRAKYKYVSNTFSTTTIFRNTGF